MRLNELIHHWLIQGLTLPSNETQFFHFGIHFHRKVPMSDVSTPNRVPLE